MPFAKIRVIGGATPAQYSNVRASISAILDKYASKAREQLLQPTATWENHTVEFTIEAQDGASRMSRFTYTTSDVYRFLNSGTKVRHVMLVGAGQGRHGNSSVGKTSVRSLNSGGGRTVGITVSKKMFNFKGIEPREWTTLVRDQLTPEFVREMEELALSYAKGAL